MDKDSVYISREAFELEFRGVPVDTWEDFTRRAGSQTFQGPSKVLTWIGVILINSAITVFIAFASANSWALGLCFTIAYGIALLIFLLRPGELQKHVASRMWPLIPILVGCIGCYIMLAFHLDGNAFTALVFMLIPHLVVAIACLLLIRAAPLWINIFVGTAAVGTATVECFEWHREIAQWIPFSIGVVATLYSVWSFRRAKEIPHDVWILHLGAAFYCIGMLQLQLIWPLALLMLLPMIVIGIAADRVFVLLLACIGILNCCFQMASDVFDEGGIIASSLLTAACGIFFIYFAMQYSAHGHIWRKYFLQKMGCPHQPLQCELLSAPDGLRGVAEA